MSIHDWTRVQAGTYHNFHYRWLATIMDWLNAGFLPRGLFAMAEQNVGGPVTDVLTLSKRDADFRPSGGGTATLAPRTSVVEEPESVFYARMTNRIAIHHSLGTVVAVIELVSPGDKDTKHALRAFTRKSAALLRNGIHLSVINPFPPGRYDPHGMHRAIWDNVTLESAFVPPAGRPPTVAGYEAGEIPRAYVEPFAVGDPLPDLPLFLDVGVHIDVPLEETYQATWNVLPVELRELLEPRPAR